MAKPDLERERQNGRRFHAKWRRFIEAGLQPVIIGRRTHPEQWQRWKNYYQLNGLPVQLEIMEARGVKTVPCLDPFDFTDAKSDGQTA